MPNNQQRGLLQVVPDLQRESHIDTGSIQQLPDSGLSRAADETAGVFSAMSAKVGALADHAASVEGSQAGRIAGIDPEFRPTHTMTIRGEAFDRAGLDIYKTKTHTEMQADFQEALLRHGHDPKQLGQIFEAKARGWQNKIIPEAWPEMSVQLEATRLSGMREASRMQLAAQHADQQAAITTQINQSMVDITRQARTMGLDPEADQALAASRAAYAKSLGRTDATGARLISPMHGVELLKHFDQQVLDSRLFGAYDRLPGLEEKKAYLAKFKSDYESGDGLGKTLNNDQFVRSYHQLEGQYRHDQANANVALDGLKEKVKGAVSLMEKGYPVAPEEMAAINSQLARVGSGAKDERLNEQLSQARQTLAVNQAMRNLPPDELASRIAAEKTRASTAGTDPLSNHRVELMDKLLTNMRTELKSDPLGWSDRVGLVKVPPLDFSKPDIAAQLQNRAVIAENVAKYYKLHLPGQDAPDGAADAAKIQYLRPDEQRQVAAVMSQGGQRALDAAALIAQTDRAPQIMGEIGKHGPTVALLGQLVANAPGGRSAVATDAANGLGLMRIPDFKPRTDHKQAREAADAVIGPALTELPKTQIAAVELANAAYEQRALLRGKTAFDADLWKQSLQEGLGRTENGGHYYGGLVYQGGWFGGSNPVVIPQNMRQTGFDSAVKAIKLTDLKEVPQMEATTASTRNGAGRKSMTDVSPQEFRNATLKSAGDGKYFMALGDPDGSDPRWLASKTGQKFVLDIKGLEWLLKSRVPSAYLGAR
jgi:hypothetical protein